MPAERPTSLPAITGIGEAHGRNKVTNAMIAPRLFPVKTKPGQTPEQAAARSVDLMGRLTRPIGIESRYWVSHDTEQVSPDPKVISVDSLQGKPLLRRVETTSAMAAEALGKAIKMARIDKNSITTITVGSGSQDYLGVSVAALVQARLGMDTNKRTSDKYAACPSWFHALFDAFNELDSRFGAVGPQAVIGAETLSPILSEQERLLYPLFGDAAGAVVLENVVPDAGAPTGVAFAFGTDGSHAEDLFMPGGGNAYPTSHETVDQDLHTLKMNPGLVKDLAIKNMAELSRKALEKAGVPMEEVALFIPHQANLEIMRLTLDALGFPQDRMMSVIDHYGNTSAASMPVALAEAWETGRVKRNDIVAFATFGAGLNFGAGIVPMVGLPKR